MLLLLDENAEPLLSEDGEFILLDGNVNELYPPRKRITTLSPDREYPYTLSEEADYACNA